jgi:hypothetical protein
MIRKPQTFVAAAAIVTAVVFGAPGCWRTTVNAGPPPKTVVSAGCPFEGCQYGRWTATRATDLWAEPDGLKLDLELYPGDEIEATSGEIHSTPRRARVVTAGADDRAEGILAGDTLYVLYPVGEGAMAIWQNGFMKVGSLDLVVDYDPPVPKDQTPLNWAWWVKCKLADGTIAWLKNPKNFRGMDRLGRSSPPAAVP